MIYYKEIMLQFLLMDKPLLEKHILWKEIVKMVWSL